MASTSFPGWWSPSCARIPLFLCTREIKKTNMAARSYFCTSFNTFVQCYFWPVLNKIRVYLTQCALLNPVLTAYFQEERNVSTESVSFKKNTCMCNAIDRDRY